MTALQTTAPQKISHHPDADLMARYSAGSLDEASALAIAAHLTFCPACRRAAATFEALGGELLADMPLASLAPDALTATLARAKSERPAVASAPTPRAGRGAVLPAPVRRYVGGDVDAVRWRAIGPGIHHAPLLTDAGVTARLLRIAPGRAVFDHSHSGTELTLVLNGSYSSLDSRFARGDIEVADESINHRPVAGAEDVCICLAVTDAPLRFDSWIGRVMQPFIGI